MIDFDKCFMMIWLETTMDFIQMETPKKGTKHRVQKKRNNDGWHRGSFFGALSSNMNEIFDQRKTENRLSKMMTL
jgi:hypothetical protein